MCLALGTLVVLGDGSTCPIQDLSPGMTVRTGKGLERAVIALHSRLFADHLVRIRSHKGAIRVTVTERHAIAVPVPIPRPREDTAHRHRRYYHGRRRRSYATAPPAPSSSWLWRAAGDLLSSDLLIAPAVKRGHAPVKSLERFPGRDCTVFNIQLDDDDPSFIAGGLLVHA